MRLKIFYIFFDFLPKLFLALFFFARVYCNLKIPLISSTISYLLLYILAFRLLVYIYQDFSLHNIKDLETYLDIKKHYYQGKHIDYISLKPEKWEKHQVNLELYVKRYLLFQDMYQLSFVYNKIKASFYYASYLFLWFKLMYLIGFIKIFLTLIEVDLPTEFYRLTFIYSCIFCLFKPPSHKS